MKKIKPSIPKIAIALISRVPPEVLINKIAVYISPLIPRSVSNAPKILFKFTMSVLNLHIHQIAENPKYLEKPDNKSNHNHKIEDIFDFVIHGDERVDKPKKNTHNNYCN
jgi:hypothetical protein